MDNEGLKQAAALCRARESEWRELAKRGGNDMFPETHARLRAYEAMTCAEMIEEMATTKPVEGL